MKKLSEIREEVANITVDPRNKIKKPADQNKHALAIAKNAKRMGLKSAMMGKHVRVSGNKKAVNDFLRITIGKSSYGDPTEKDMTTPQIDKMLNKGLKEKSYGAGEEGTDELKKKYKKDTPMEGLKTTHVVINTADGNKVVATASDEKGAKASVASAERPPMNIKNKKTLKIVKLKRPVGNKQVDRMVGYPLKESLEENAIPKIKQIVAKKQAMKIDGVMVDMFTASAISQIYDKVNDANKKKMEKMKVTQLANAAMKLMRRNSVSEGLWDNIRAKRARGERMRKKGEKGAPTQDQIKRAQGESVEEATVFKKGKFEIDFERGQVRMTMKGSSPSAIPDRIYMSKAEFTALQKELPRVKLKEEFDIEIAEGKMKDVSMDAELMGLYTKAMKVMPGSPKQKDIIKQINKRRKALGLRENKDRAFRDFRRAGGGRKRGVDPADQDLKATDDDRKAASKNIIMQLRRVSDLPRGGKVEFENGKTINVTKKDAVKIGQFFDRLRKPQDKAKFQAMIYKSPADMKKVLSKLR